MLLSWHRHPKSSPARIIKRIDNGINGDSFSGGGGGGGGDDGGDDDVDDDDDGDDDDDDENNPKDNP